MSCVITLCPECRSFQRAGGACTICRAPVKARTTPPTLPPEPTPAEPPPVTTPTGRDGSGSRAA
jgi:hypothetical protein